VVAFNPVGSRLATAGADAAIRIWDVETKTLAQTLRGHDDGVSSLAFSPTGDRLAAAGGDGTVRMWDPATAIERQILDGCAGHVRAVVFSPDGQRVAATGADGAVWIWDTGAETAPMMTLLPLPDGGWATLLPDLSYKLEGAANGAFWYASGACRFEPGELDRYVDGPRRLPPDAPLP
jgi:WD40 repeat protein